MPPESLPFNRKDFLKDRKPSSSDPIGIVPARLNEPPTTPSQLNNYGSSSNSRWGGVGGPSDFRRPFSGQGHHGKRVKTTDESSNKENNINASISPMTSPNGNFHPNSDFVNSSDQHPKNNGGGISTTNSSPRLELGTSLDWKPLKWIRSGSLSSRGSSFSHQSSCKIIGVVPIGSKVDADLVNASSGDVGPPKTPDDASSRKKPRLGWGEGLAKYEKKKVDPDDLLTSPSNLSECASPNTPYAFACSSSPGVEEKESSKTVTVDDNTSNHKEELALNLESSLSSSIDELLQTDESNSHTAMEKLQLWKAEVTRTVEITETEIDSLENELKSLVSNESSCPVPDASISLPTELNNETCEEMAMEKSDSSPEEEEDEKSPETSECSEGVGNDDTLGIVTSCEDGSEFSTENSSTDADSDSVSWDVYYVRQDKLNDYIVATNKAIGKEASDELRRLLLPTTTHLSSITLQATNDSLTKERLYTRKRFLKLKERIITSKFRALQYSWKQDVQMLSLRRIGAKSQKKFELSSRLGYADHQKNRLSSPGGSMTLVPTLETLEYVKKLVSDSRVKVYRNAIKMPCMILDRKERLMTRFISDNALVEDPIEAEKERSTLNSWTKEEAKTFLENYCLFGKKFKKIASFLAKKTIAECVEFYYKNHKSDPFQNAKKYFKSSNKGTSSSRSCPTTYLVTSARRSNQETCPTSLEILGAASAMVAADVAKPDFPMLCNEQEKDAADVLAGICGSVSLGSCVTRCQVSSLNEVDEGGCSDESCGEEVENCDWTDEEKAKLMEGVRRYGKNFIKISRFVGSRSGNECRVFFSKARKCLGLDDIDGGHRDACMVDNDNGSDISHDVVVPLNKPEVELVGERSPENTSCYRQEIRDESEERELPFTDLNLDLNESEKEDGFLMTDFFPHRKTDDVSSTRLSFRKSSDNMYPVVNNNGGLSYSGSSPQGNLKLDKSLLMDPCLPRDFTSLFQDSRKTSSPDVEKSNTSGAVKLFGQIITKKPQEPSVVKPFDLKFDNTKSTSLNLDQSPNNNHHYNNLPSRSYGFLDGNKIQTGLGLPTIPDSARLLAKYPAAFSKTSSFLKFDHNQQLQSSLKMVSGFPTIIPNINNGGATYQMSGNQKGVQVHPFTIDKLLLPDMSTGKVSSGSRGMNVISGVSVSDPVAAIRMHYAQTQQHYKNGSNASDMHYNR